MPASELLQSQSLASHGLVSSETTTVVTPATKVWVFPDEVYLMKDIMILLLPIALLVIVMLILIGFITREPDYIDPSTLDRRSTTYSRDLEPGMSLAEL